MAMKMKSMKMKVMKAMKMKSMAKVMKMKKSMKKSVIAKGYKLSANAKAAVFKGKFMKTVGGLKASDLVKSKSGKIVSKKASLKGKKSKWIIAVGKARKELKLKGFFAVKKGSALYKKA